MSLSDDRRRGVLSPADRQYLNNPDDYSRQAANERKKAITQRVRDGVLDLAALLDELSTARRREILGGQAGRVDPEHIGDVLATDDDMTEAITDAVAFLYIAAADRQEQDHRGTIKEAVRRAEQRRGPPARSVEVELNIETTDLNWTATQAQQRMADGGELSDSHVRALLETGRVSPEKLAEYVQDGRAADEPE